MNAIPKKILLTGATGFIGRATLAALERRGLSVRAISRSHAAHSTGAVEWRQGDLSTPAGWDRLLDGVDVVVHLAGNAGRGTEDEMMRANADASEMLARAAAAAAVGRFVYASSIRVYGHQHRIDAATEPAPADAYGRSKLAAEAALVAEAAANGMAYSVLRPPFVYGADRAGLISLLTYAARYRLPLPLSALKNRRSLIYVANLADLIAAAAQEPPEPGSYRLPAGEGLDLTYGELFARIGDALGRPVSAFPVSPRLLGIAGGLLLSRETMRRMLEDCIVDASALSGRLDWTPPISTAEALQAVVFRI